MEVCREDVAAISVKSRNFCKRHTYRMLNFEPSALRSCLHTFCLVVVCLFVAAAELLRLMDELFGVLSQLRNLSQTARNRFARSMSYLGETMIRELFGALPEMCRSVLETPTLFPTKRDPDDSQKVRCTMLKFMLPNEVRTLSLTRAQVFCLMSHSFLGLLSVTSRANFLHLYYGAGVR